MNPDQNQGQDDAHTHREVQLGAEDARAVDRWMAGESAENARDMRVADIFGLLNAESAISADSTLTDLTMVRVLRAMGSEASVEGDAPPELAPLDAEALDAWLLAEGDAERVPTALRSRAARHQALADLVRDGEQPQVSADIVDRLMTRVSETPVAASASTEPEIAGRIRLADLMSIAAVLVIGVSVIWPMLTSMRDAHYRTVSSSRMAAVGNGMAAYAASYGALPQASASLAGDPWWEVGENPAHSNSANLFTLTTAGFVEIAQLASPPNPNAPTRGTAEDASALLADRSPVVPPSRRGEAARADANSRNFSGRGQHVLFGDGRVRWLTSPILESGDNIWLPGSVERDLIRDGRATLTGRETADGPEDAFLVP